MMDLVSYILKLFARDGPPVYPAAHFIYTPLYIHLYPVTQQMIAVSSSLW